MENQTLEELIQLKEQLNQQLDKAIETRSNNEKVSAHTRYKSTIPDKNQLQVIPQKRDNTPPN